MFWPFPPGTTIGATRWCFEPTSGPAAAERFQKELLWFALLRRLLVMRIVNFGCGAEGSYDHLNVDGSVTVLLARLPIPAWAFGRRAQFIAAIRKNHVKYGTASRLRFPPASLDAFYTSHTLEHLSRHDCEELLQRVHKWLKPNGILRVVLPDLR